MKCVKCYNFMIFQQWMLEEVNCCIGYYIVGIYFDIECNYGDLVYV